jgi:hypothetical protein
MGRRFVSFLGVTAQIVSQEMLQMLLRRARAAAEGYGRRNRVVDVAGSH